MRADFCIIRYRFDKRLLVILGVSNVGFYSAVVYFMVQCSMYVKYAEFGRATFRVWGNWLIFSILLNLCDIHAEAVQRLTISGLSRADFAIPFHVSHLSLVSGAAAFAGQPYHFTSLPRSSMILSLLISSFSREASVCQ